jgi:drug/metabolite transporter (DMT)-like permease
MPCFCEMAREPKQGKDGRARFLPPHSPSSGELVGYIYAFFAATLFGLNGVVTKVMMESGLDALQVTQFRVIGAALISGVVLLIISPQSFRLPKKQIVPISIMAVVGVALLQATYALALNLLPVGIALLLEYTAVPMVALVAFFFFKERVRKRLWVSIGFVMGGLAIVAQIWASTLNPLGVMWGLVAAVSLATYFLVGERQLQTISPLALLFWTMTIATVFWSFFSGWWNVPPGILSTSVSLQGSLEAVEAPLWVLLVWNVSMGSFLPFLLSLAALKRLSATAAGIAATSEVAFAFFFAWMWLVETITSLQSIGALLVLAGIVVAQTSRRNPVVVQADLALETGPIILPEWDNDTSLKEQE